MYTTSEQTIQQNCNLQKDIWLQTPIQIKSTFKRNLFFFLACLHDQILFFLFHEIWVCTCKLGLLQRKLLKPILVWLRTSFRSFSDRKSHRGESSTFSFSKKYWFLRLSDDLWFYWNLISPSVCQVVEIYRNYFKSKSGISINYFALNVKVIIEIFFKFFCPLSRMKTNMSANRKYCTHKMYKDVANWDVLDVSNFKIKKE